MYRAYLKTKTGVLSESKTNTTDPQAALVAFTNLVKRTDLDGKTMAAVLTFNKRQLAYHRFDCEPGMADYWRDRLEELQNILGNLRKSA